MKPVLIWTRARSDWDADQALLHKQGLDRVSSPWQILHLPCLELKPVPAHKPLSPYSHAVITSQNALHFCHQDADLWQMLQNTHMVYTHGPSTAAALRELGLKVSLIETARTASELALQLPALLAADATMNVSVALPGPEEPAFDLQAALRAAHVKAEHITCYRADAGLKDAEGLSLAADTVRQYQGVQGVVCFASPSAVQGFCQTLKPQTNRLQTALTALCIGPTTAAACQGHFASIKTAPENSLDALLGLLHRL